VSPLAQPPHELELVIHFVNTLDVESGTDELASAAAVAEWLRERQLLADDAPAPGEQEREQAIRLREALRTLMLAHNGAEAATGDALALLERTAREGRLGVRFNADGSVDLTPEADGFAAALARLLAPVARGIDDGSWRRVKACRAEDCRWAFYDRSRNRSGVWCEMAVCGNRTKVRAYRERSRD
jgi:predicted RNA-binding Zn ribbon-like protein